MVPEKYPRWQVRILSDASIFHMNNTNDKTLFALTHVNEYGHRRLTRANQGRNHFETKEKGEEYLATFLKNNSQERLDSVFGKCSAGTFEIRPVLCYHHGDAKGIYFD